MVISMIEERFTDIAHASEKIPKVLQDMINANETFNRALATMFLSVPIPMSYETWSFLHEIADGDVDD